MLPGERLIQWLDKVGPFFADRLGKWGGTMIGAGFDTFAKILGKSAAPKLTPLIDLLEKSGEVPPELKPILDEMKDPTGEAAAIFSQAGGGAVLGGAIGQIIDALLRPMGYWMQRTAQNRLPDLLQIMAFWLRGAIKDEDLEYFITSHGFPKGMVDNFRDLSKIRLDFNQVITAWRRDPAAYEPWFKDLADQGWSPERIEALKHITKVMPTPRDYVGFLAHEVFEPDMIAKYGLLSEWDRIDKEPAKKIGLLEEELRLYWMDHWEHPEWGTIRELRHRDQITDDDVRDWFRIVEIPEYWRPKMLNVLWSLPNRIEIRMMARYLDMSKEEIMDLLKKAGLAEEFRSDAADFMMIMGLTGYWASMLSKGWMSPTEVKADIDGRGFKPVTAERIYKRLVSVEKPERTTGERDLTKTDIYKGVKQNRITRAEAADLLMDLGFDSDEADILLDTNIPEDEEDVVVARRELTKADILKGLKTDVITRAQARDRLLGLRYSPADAEFLLKIFDAQVKPPVEPAAREASKADIITAVKKGLITPEDAYLMLQDINFTPEASEFILAVKAEVSPFSPINFAEFKERSQKYRRAAGMEIVEMPEEVKAAADEVVRLTGERDALTQSIEEEKRGLVAEEIIPEETTRRLKSLQVKRNRAESKLSAAKSDYDRLVAEWRHGLP